MSETYRRILIIKPSALGDVFHGLPVLHGLRIAYPEAHIAWMVNSAFADVIRGHEALNEVIEFDRTYYRRFRMWWSPRSHWRFWRWICGVRRRRFDLVVDLQGLLRSGLFAWFSGSKVRFGLPDARECSSRFHNRSVPQVAGAIHAVDMNYLLAGPLGFADVKPTFDLPIDPSARDAARAKLAAAGLEAGRPYSVIAPGAGRRSKCWPANRFAQVADVLAERGVTPVLVGAPKETGIAAAVCRACACKPIDLVGKTGIKEMMALIGSAAIVVCNDSGPMHIAAALGRPLVAIFGPTDPARTGPYGRPDCVVRGETSTDHDYRHSDTTAVCKVTVDMALAVLDRQLRSAQMSAQ